MYFNTGTTTNTNSFDLTPTFAGDQISWSMPASLPITGNGFIVFRFGYSTGAAVSCVGATESNYSAEAGCMHSVTLAQ